MWPFDIFAKRRATEEAKRRAVEQRRTMTVAKPTRYYRDSMLTRSAASSDAYSDPLSPVNPLSPLNPSTYYTQSMLAPADELWHSPSHCDTSSSHSSHSSSDYTSSHSSHDHSCSSSSYDSGSSSSSSDY